MERANQRELNSETIDAEKVKCHTKVSQLLKRYFDLCTKTLTHSKMIYVITKAIKFTYGKSYFLLYEKDENNHLITLTSSKCFTKYHQSERLRYLPSKYLSNFNTMTIWFYPRKKYLYSQSDKMLM